MMNKIRENYIRLAEAYGDDEDRRADIGRSADPFGAPAIGKVKQGGEYGDTPMQTQRPQTGGSVTGPFDPTTMPGHVPRGAKPTTTKPVYKGHFFAQTAKLGKKYIPKKVSWKDQASGDRKYGRVQGSEAVNDWVWDGNEWITPGAFDLKYGGLKTAASGVSGRRPSENMNNELYKRIFERRCR